MTDFCDKIIGDYRLLEELNRGSYGCLYLGQSLSKKDYVAVKILSKSGLTDEQLLLQQLEIDIQQQLDHTHLLHLDHVIQEQDYTYMIMELCEGGDLFDHVERGINNIALIKSYFSQILDAIEYLHEHEIYHRDIKLENILIHHDRTLKVGDFGLATRDKLSMDFGCGSTTYLGPEHFEEEDQEKVLSEPYDTSKSDIWSLGILLLTLLFGENPWEQATTDIDSFRAYKENKSALKKLFPSLSWECMIFLNQVLEIDPIKRLDIKEMKASFLQLDHLLIHNPWPIKASFDSAIFSQEGTSWSDIVEEDLQIQDDYELIKRPDNIPLDDDNSNMFIHDQEKESWWL